MIYDYDKIMAEKPCVFYSCCNYDLVEHPEYGDEAPAVAVSHTLRKAWCTTYYDPLDDEGDMHDIYEQFKTLAAREAEQITDADYQRLAAPTELALEPKSEERIINKRVPATYRW
jgi:hypothetical protein